MEDPVGSVGGTLFAADGAIRTTMDGETTHAHVSQIHGQQGASKQLTETGKGFYGLHRAHAADGTRHRTEDR